MNWIKTKKIKLKIILANLIFAFYFATSPIYAAGDVAGVIENTWQQVLIQLKQVVNNVIFPALDVILLVFFVVKLSTSYFDYRKSQMFDWTAPAILFACLIFTLTAPLYIWSIL